MKLTAGEILWAIASTYIKDEFKKNRREGSISVEVK